MCEGFLEVGGGYACEHRRWATGAFGGGVPKWVTGTHANTATEAFCGAPYAVTKRVRGVPKWV
eukprot:6436156-Pyramimonas_sp.AAC.1